MATKFISADGYIPACILGANDSQCFAASGGSYVQTFDTTLSDISPATKFNFGTIARIYATGVEDEIFVLSKDGSDRYSLYLSTDKGETGTEVLKVGLIGGTHYANILGMERSFCVAIIGGVTTYLFGEYNVIARGSRVSGVGNDAVRIWKSTNKTDWTVLAEFNQDGSTTNIYHIHGVFFDAHSGNVYVACGDAGVGNKEAGIIRWIPDVGLWENNKDITYYANKSGFSSISGSQDYRAVDLLFTENHVHWVADSTNVSLTHGFFRADKDLTDVTSRPVSLPDGGSGGDFVGSDSHFGWTGAVSQLGNIIVADYWQSAANRVCSVYSSSDEGETYRVIGNVICGATATSNYVNFYKFGDKILIANPNSPIEYGILNVTNVLTDSGQQFEKTDFISFPHYRNVTAESYAELADAESCSVSQSVSDILYIIKYNGLYQYLMSALFPAFGSCQNLGSFQKILDIAINKEFSSKSMSQQSAGKRPRATMGSGAAFDGLDDNMVQSAAVTGTVARADVKISRVAGAAFIDLGPTINLAQYGRSGKMLVLRSVTDPAKCMYGFIKEAGTGETYAEKVANGTFDADAASWTPTAGATLSVVASDRGAGNQLWVNRTGSGARAAQALTVAAGACLNISAWAKSSNGYAVSLVRNSGGDSIGAQTGNLYNTAWTYFSAVACSLETNPEVWLSSPAATGALAYFDDVSVKQILTPSIYGVKIVNTHNGTTYNWVNTESSFNVNDPLGYTFELIECEPITRASRTAYGEFSTVAFVAASQTAGRTIVSKQGPSLMSYALGTGTTDKSKARASISSDGTSVSALESVDTAFDGAIRSIAMSYTTNSGGLKIGVDGEFGAVANTGKSALLYTTRAQRVIGADTGGANYAARNFFNGNFYGLLEFSVVLTDAEFEILSSLKNLFKDDIVYGDAVAFDGSMPTLALADTAPGKLKQVQEWTSANVSKSQIDRVSR